MTPFVRLMTAGAAAGAAAGAGALLPEAAAAAPAPEVAAAAPAPAVAGSGAAVWASATVPSASRLPSARTAAVLVTVIGCISSKRCGLLRTEPPRG